MIGKLTPKQAAFCEQYLVDLNAAAAARRAGYSVRYADREGWRMLRKVEIQEKIGVLMAERAKRVGIEADEVLREIARVAYGSLGDFCTWGPEGVVLRDASLVAPEKLRALESIVHTQNAGGSSTRVRLKNSVGALEMLARHLGLFDKDKVELVESPHDPERLARTLAILQQHGFRIPNAAFAARGKGLEKGLAGGSDGGKPVKHG